MKFKLNETAVNTESKGILLNTTKLISPEDPEIFQSLKLEYDDMNSTSKFMAKGAAALICAILTHERVYFAMTRKTLQNLMLNDPNLPAELRKSFSPNNWARMLSAFYNDFGLIKLKVPGTKRRSSVFEVVHPEILTYLTPKVNAEKQLIDAVKFSQGKKR